MFIFIEGNLYIWDWFGGKMGNKEKNGARKWGDGILYKLYGGKNDQVIIIAGKKITQCFYAQRERYHRCLLLKV